MLYLNIGSLYTKQQKYNKALEYYEKALEIQKLTIGEKHVTTAIIYRNIGIL